MYENGLQNLILKNVKDKNGLVVWHVPVTSFWNHQHCLVCLAFSQAAVQFFLSVLLFVSRRFLLCTFLVLKNLSSKPWAVPTQAVPEPRRHGVERYRQWLGLTIMRNNGSFYVPVGRGGSFSCELVLKCLAIICQWKLAVACQDEMLCQHRCQRTREVSEGSNWRIR